MYKNANNFRRFSFNLAKTHENRERTIYLTNFKKENIQDEIYVYVQGDYLFVYMESYNYLIWSIRCHGLINGPGEEKVHHRHK